MYHTCQLSLLEHQISQEIPTVAFFCTCIYVPVFMYHTCQLSLLEHQISQEIPAVAFFCTCIYVPVFMYQEIPTVAFFNFHSLFLRCQKGK